jgi:hypothetical protein
MAESRMKSADNILFQEEAKRMNQPIVSLEGEAKKEQAQEKEAPDIAKDTSLESSEDNLSKEEILEEEGETKKQEETQAIDDTTPSDNTENLDEYGNTVVKQKTYTEEEVQAMIRKRLRDKHTEQPTVVEQAAQDFKADPESEESWEKQLGDFVEKKITDLAIKKQKQEWQSKEQLTQEEFESKFTSGMSKYDDFDSVVSGKPITTSMMMATRSMEHPAAFLYAACKQQPAEIERIAKMTDPYAQVAEIGRLEERMKKARVITSSPKPSRKISGDTTNDMPNEDIDSRIASHAKSKIIHNRK